MFPHINKRMFPFKKHPLRGDKFIKVPFAIFLTYDGYYTAPDGKNVLTKGNLKTVEVQKDTLWAISHDLHGKVGWYYEYSKKHPKVPPILFGDNEVILLDKHGKQIT